MAIKPIKPVDKQADKQVKSKKSGKVTRSRTGAATSRVTGSSIDVPDDSDSADGNPSQRQRDLDFLSSASTTFKAIANNPNEEKIRANALEDLKFYNNDQWPANIANLMATRNRPMITVNRIKPAVRQVVNGILQDRPDIKVLPVDDRADLKTAEIFQGIIRHVETNSMADVAYDNAITPQCIHGRGVIELTTDYPTPLSFDQEAYIKSVENPFSVYLGPATEPDGSDRDDAFMIFDFTPEQHITRFGKSNGITQWGGYRGSLNDYTGIGNGHQLNDWGGKNRIRVAKYFKRRHEKARIVLFNDGTTMLEDRIPAEFLNDDSNPMGIIDLRETTIPRVTITWFNALEKLEETDWPGMYIPLVEVQGDKQIVDGEIFLTGIVRDAKDAQRQYNYFRSKTTQAISLAPDAPYIMAEGQDEGHETEWKQDNIMSQAVKRYKPTSISGQLTPPPKRDWGEPPIQAMVLAAAQYEGDIKATTQVYDPQLGGRSNEVSGVAQRTRINQAQIGNFTFPNNFIRALRFLGMQLIDLIPKIYDARSVARIIGLDDKAQRVQVINDPMKPAHQQQPNADGSAIESIYNLGVGQYDVVVGIGPSYMTQQQEVFDSLMKMINSYPQLAGIVGDLVMKSSGIPGAEEAAARIKRTIPPNITGEDPNALPPQVQQGIQKMQKMIQLYQGEIQRLTEIVNSNQQEQQAKLQIETIRSQTDLQMNAMDNRVKELAVVATAHSNKVDQLMNTITMMLDHVNAEKDRANAIDIVKAKPQPKPNTN